MEKTPSHHSLAESGVPAGLPPRSTASSPHAHSLWSGGGDKEEGESRETAESCRGEEWGGGRGGGERGERVEDGSLQSSQSCYICHQVTKRPI